MTSPVKLPPLPLEVESVYVDVDGLSTYRGARDCYYTMDQMHAYAEQAVREALAAQEPVAYLNAEALDRLHKPYVAGCAAALEKTPRGGFVAIAVIPNIDKDPPC